MQAECEGKLFGHNYLPNGICQNCRGFQKPLKGMEKIEIPQKKNKSTSARAFLVSQFLEELNKGRKGTTYPLLTPARMGMILSPIKKLEDLRWLWDYCMQGEPKKFQPKVFWWKLKN